MFHVSLITPVMGFQNTQNESLIHLNKASTLHLINRAEISRLRHSYALPY